MKELKKWGFFLAVLLILIPVGIILPHILNSGNAWGEWDTEQIKTREGHVPEGMQKDANIYHAPFSDYTIKTNKSGLFNKSLDYYISAIIGTGIILILTFGFYKFYVRHKQ